MKDRIEEISDSAFRFLKDPGPQGITGVLTAVLPVLFALGLIGGGVAVWFWKGPLFGGAMTGMGTFILFLNLPGQWRKTYLNFDVGAGFVEERYEFIRSTVGHSAALDEYDKIVLDMSSEPPSAEYKILLGKGNESLGITIGRSDDYAEVRHWTEQIAKRLALPVENTIGSTVTLRTPDELDTSFRERLLEEPAEVLPEFSEDEGDSNRERRLDETGQTASSPEIRKTGGQLVYIIPPMVSARRMAYSGGGCLLVTLPLLLIFGVLSGGAVLGFPVIVVLIAYPMYRTAVRRFATEKRVCVTSDTLSVEVGDEVEKIAVNDIEELYLDTDNERGANVWQRLGGSTLVILTDEAKTVLGHSLSREDVEQLYRDICEMITGRAVEELRKRAAPEEGLEDNLEKTSPGTDSAAKPEQNNRNTEPETPGDRLRENAEQESNEWATENWESDWT